MRVSAEQGHEYSHEVRFTGAEGALEEGSLVLSFGDGAVDQCECGVEGVGDRGGHHVVGEGGAQFVGGSGLGELEYERRGTRMVGNREDLPQGGACAGCWGAGWGEGHGSSFP